MGNPDASRSFAAHASDRSAPHGPADRAGLPDSVGRPSAGLVAALPARSRRHSKSGRGRNSCRSAPGRGSATQEQAGRAFRQIGLNRAWTASDAGGILPRHACSAPCGARRRTRTWRFRSAPCLPFSRWSSAPLCARHRCDCACGRGRACGYVDNARALPTYPQAQQHQPASVGFIWKGLRLSQHRSPLGGLLPHLGRQLRHLSADPGSRSHLIRCFDLRRDRVRFSRASGTALVVAACRRH